MGTDFGSGYLLGGTTLPSSWFWGVFIPLVPFPRKPEGFWEEGGCCTEGCGQWAWWGWPLVPGWPLVLGWSQWFLSSLDSMILCRWVGCFAHRLKTPSIWWTAAKLYKVRPGNSLPVFNHSRYGLGAVASIWICRERPWCGCMDASLLPGLLLLRGFQSPQPCLRSFAGFSALLPPSSGCALALLLQVLVHSKAQRCQLLLPASLGLLVGTAVLGTWKWLCCSCPLCRTWGHLSVLCPISRALGAWVLKKRFLHRVQSGIGTCCSWQRWSSTGGV